MAWVYSRGYSFRVCRRVQSLGRGCGEGTQLSGLAAEGLWPCGIDPSMTALQTCKTRSLSVVRGRGECLPFLSGSLRFQNEAGKRPVEPARGAFLEACFPAHHAACRSRLLMLAQPALVQ